ncbi:uncharacterized protein LOC118794582 [Megalops cyprinoides]|uniref:uncharacterized protein LOC118794582 n=1 Tax=Megalops cyprinoides TaxID=118141 RepID=UPI0018645594|nr:uncharacterized protein LOC118794582 [Megalops cyprinoides]
MKYVILLFFVGFVLLMSEAHLNGPSVNCFNDYKTTMICDFTSNKPLNCSGYSLDILSGLQEHFTCVFVNTERDSNKLFKCGCTVEMLEFVSGDKYSASLLKEGKVLNSRNITALDKIKPQAPEILSVTQTDDGNFKVTWRTNYSENSVFGKSLKTQLRYKKKGEADEVASSNNCTGTFCIIPGSELEPSSEYVIKARSYSTKYGTEFSDWSNDMEWITPESTERVLKIIIPILFVLLIISICAFYWCCNKLKAKWWDRIPNPSNDIKKMLPGNPKVFIPKQYDPSSKSIDILRISAAEEKLWDTPLIEGSGQDDPYNPVTSCMSTKDSGISSFDDSQKCLSDSKGSCCSSESGYKSVLYSKVSVAPFHISQDIPKSEIPSCPAQPKPCCDSCCVSCRDSSSKGEIWSPLEHIQRNLEALPLFSKAPITVTELEYQPCDGGKTSTSPAEGISLASSFQMDIQDTILPSRLSNTCRADDGYESFSETISKTTMGQHDFPACTLSPSEEGYQALQSTTCNNTNWLSVADDKEALSVEGREEFSGDQWEAPQCPKCRIPDSISYATQFMQKLNQESPSHSALTAPSMIQTFIDSAYHKV